MFVVASCVEELRARVEALEAMRETEKAAVLDLYQQYDKLKEWVGKNYLRIRALESALLPDLGPIQGH
jgi:cell division protein FtsX